jgi:YD repeat-containing protein
VGIFFRLPSGCFLICLSVFCTSEKTHPALSRFIGAATTSLIPKQRISQTDGPGRLTDVWEIRSTDSVAGTAPVTFPGHAEVQAGYRTKYSYDALDDLKQATQQIGTTGTTQTRMFSYDGLKRLTQAINPESGTTNYTYDANSNLETRQNSRLITTTYTYDAQSSENPDLYQRSTEHSVSHLQV